MKKIYPLLLLLISLSISSQVNLSNSLTACYALDGNASEPINALTGTISAAVTPTVNRFGTPNTAYAFNGSFNNRIELPDDPLLKPTNAISFSCWVRTNVVNNQYIIFTKNVASSNFEAYTLNYNTLSGKLKFRLQKGASGSTTILDGSSTVTAGSWHHVAGSITSNSLTLYVDGAVDGGTTTAIPFQYVSGKRVILGSSNEPGFDLPLNGSLDNVRFYNRVLTPAEVSWMYTYDPICVGNPPVSIFTPNPLNTCINKFITLNDGSINSPTMWNWGAPGAAPATSTLNNPVISYPAPGVYTISLVASNSFGYGNPAYQSVNISPGPTVTAVSSNSIVCVGNSATLTASGATTYSWSTGQTTSAIVITPTSSGTYTVLGTASGCQNTAGVFINVSLCTGISENFSSASFDIYPNPSSGKFVISSDKKITDVSVYNLLGELVVKANDNSSIDIADKPNGVYFVKLNINGRSTTKKIVKQ
jgi:hypothetical protein